MRKRLAITTTLLFVFSTSWFVYWIDKMSRKATRKDRHYE